jgi:hypothetical protein
MIIIKFSLLPKSKKKKKILDIYATKLNIGKMGYFDDFVLNDISCIVI